MIDKPKGEAETKRQSFARQKSEELATTTVRSNQVQFNRKTDDFAHKYRYIIAQKQEVTDDPVPRARVKLFQPANSLSTATISLKKTERKVLEHEVNSSAMNLNGVQTGSHELSNLPTIDSRSPRNAPKFIRSTETFPKRTQIVRHSKENLIELSAKLLKVDKLHSVQQEMEPLTTKNDIRGNSKRKFTLANVNQLTKILGFYNIVKSNENVMSKNLYKDAASIVNEMRFKRQKLRLRVSVYKRQSERAFGELAPVQGVELKLY